MSGSRMGIDPPVDYARYLRGCDKLGWQPLPFDVFREKYTAYWNARCTINRMDEGRYSEPNWVRRTKDFTRKRERQRLTLIEQQLGYLHTAVAVGLESESGNGSEESGIPAPILTGPVTRSGAACQEIPHNPEEDSTA